MAEKCFFMKQYYAYTPPLPSWVTIPDCKAYKAHTFEQVTKNIDKCVLVIAMLQSYIYPCFTCTNVLLKDVQMASKW